MPSIGHCREAKEMTFTLPVRLPASIGQFRSEFQAGMITLRAELVPHTICVVGSGDHPHVVEMHVIRSSSPVQNSEVDRLLRRLINRPVHAERVQRRLHFVMRPGRITDAEIDFPPYAGKGTIAPPVFDCRG